MSTNSDGSGKPNTEETWEDPIVAEVRAVRDKIAARFDYDIDRIFEHYVSLDKERRKTRDSIRAGYPDSCMSNQEPS